MGLGSEIASPICEATRAALQATKKWGHHRSGTLEKMQRHPGTFTIRFQAHKCQAHTTEDLALNFAVM